MGGGLIADGVDRPAVVSDEFEDIRWGIPEVGDFESGVDAFGFLSEEAESLEGGGVVVIVPEFLVEEDVVVVGGDGGFADGVGQRGVYESVLGG